VKKNASSTEENYLKSLFLLANGKSEVNISDLSEALKVSTPTANSMVKRLSEKGWVNYIKYKPIRVTEKGQKLAASIIRKHRLTEMYLVEKMGFGWEEVHDIAEQVEHIESPEFFDRMDELLGSPVSDPHGSPIPDREGRIHSHHYVALSTMKKGQVVMIKGLNDSSREFLEYLNSKGLALGLIIEIYSIDGFDKTMIIKVKEGKEIVLGSEACTRLLVTLIQ